MPEIVIAVGAFLKTNGYASLAEAATKLGMEQQGVWDRIMGDAGLPACKMSVNVVLPQLEGQAAPDRPQIPIVVYWSGEGFATASGTGPQPGKATGLQ